MINNISLFDVGGLFLHQSKFAISRVGRIVGTFLSPGYLFFKRSTK